MRRSRSMIGLAVLVALWPPRGTVAQAGSTAAQYLAAVERYVTGAPLDSAIEPLKGWTRKQFDGVGAELVFAERPVREAAAVLQLELVLTFATAGSASIALDHARYGTEFLMRQPNDARSRMVDPDATAFNAKWFGVVASAFLSINDGVNAEPLLERGLRLTPESAPLKTQIGAARELQVAAPLVDLWTVNLREPRSARRARQLLPMLRLYSEATQHDPAFVDGWLRLGRVQFILGYSRDATASMTRARELARTPREKYLAALTLGAIQQRDNDLAAARKSYEDAEAAIPNSQSAVVALAYLDVLAGRPDLAQQRARQFVAADTDDIAWWEFKNSGLDRDGIEWLRRRVRR